jgi:hypothetical protein
VNIAEEADAWFKEYGWILPDEQARRQVKQFVIRAFAAGVYAAQQEQKEEEESHRGEISCTSAVMERRGEDDLVTHKPPFGFRSAR